MFFINTISFIECDKIMILIMEFVGIDKFSLLDYEDKVSCVLFCKPCNFRCPFCHNGTTVLEADTTIPFEEILEYLKSRKGLIDAVVVSGGEPTLMPDLKEKIIQLKELGFLVKLDTNGTNPEIVKDLYESHLIDYVAMDIKNYFDKYPLTTGIKVVDTSKIEQSIKYLMTSGIDYEFRTTLVDEFHDIEDIKKMSQVLKGAKRLYLQKFVERESCIQKGLHEVNKEKAEQFIGILKETIDNVSLRGY